MFEKRPLPPCPVEKESSIDLWMAYLSFGVPVASDYGTVYWHAHEMLFGFAPAVLAGFRLTAIPNWTGRLPIAGRPLAVLFSVWCAGRITMLLSGSIGIILATAVDGLFLPAMLLICARGRGWKKMEGFESHRRTFYPLVCKRTLPYRGYRGAGPELAIRFGIGAYVLLVTIVGGRILPSFTRNWINQFGRTDFPVPYNSFDAATIIIGAVALVLWACLPNSTATCGTAGVAAVLNMTRLVRWRGWTTWPEPILFVLHATFLFVPIGFTAISLQASGWLPEVAVLHIFAIGTISTMMLAVMTRATRGHTGRKLKSSCMTNISLHPARLRCARPAARRTRPWAEHRDSCCGGDRLDGGFRIVRCGTCAAPVVGTQASSDEGRVIVLKHSRWQLGGESP